MKIKKSLLMLASIALVGSAIAITTPLLVSCSSSGSNGEGGSSSSPTTPSIKQNWSYTNPISQIQQIISSNDYNNLMNKQNNVFLDGKNSIYIQQLSPQNDQGKYLNNQLWYNNYNLNYLYINNNIVSFCISNYETISLETKNIPNTPNMSLENQLCINLISYYYNQENDSWYSCKTFKPNNLGSYVDLNLECEIDAYAAYANNQANWSLDTNATSQLASLKFTNSQVEQLINYKQTQPDQSGFIDKYSFNSN